MINRKDIRDYMCSVYDDVRIVLESLDINSYLSKSTVRL